MSGERKRMIALLAALLAVAALVAADRLGGADDAPGDDAPDAEQAHLKQAALVEQMRALVSQAEDWRRAEQRLEERWREARSRMIEASTAEIAAARLDERVQMILTDLGLNLDSSSTLAAETPMEGEALRVIGLSLSLRAPNPDVLYALIDRIEHMPEAASNVDRLSVRGPMRTGGAGLAVEIDLRALAWIGDEA